MVREKDGRGSEGRRDAESEEREEGEGGMEKEENKDESRE